MRSADDADTDLRPRGSVRVNALVTVADDEHVIGSFGHLRPQKSPLRWVEVLGFVNDEFDGLIWL